MYKLRLVLGVLGRDEMLLLQSQCLPFAHDDSSLRGTTAWR